MSNMEVTIAVVKEEETVAEIAVVATLVVAKVPATKVSIAQSGLQKFI
jgi:hypothetical protein